MGKPLFYEIVEKPVSSCIITLCTVIWLYIQKKSVGYADVGMSYDSVVTERQHWRVITSAFSHISILHLVFNMNALWSLGVIEQLKHVGLGVEFYLHYTLILIILSAFLVLAVYHLLIHRFNLEYYKRVTAVGYSCVVFGWMTILSVKQPSSKLDLFGVLSLPISFAPFESLVFTSIIVPQASFLGHLAGIIVGYSIAWGLIQGVTNYWAVVFLGWILVACLFSLKRSSTFPMQFLEIEHVADSALPQLGLLSTDVGSEQTIMMTRPIHGSDLV